MTKRAASLADSGCVSDLKHSDSATYPRPLVHFPANKKGHQINFCTVTKFIDPFTGVQCATEIINLIDGFKMFWNTSLTRWNSMGKATPKCINIITNEVGLHVRQISQFRSIIHCVDAVGCWTRRASGLFAVIIVFELIFSWKPEF